MEGIRGTSRNFMTADDVLARFNRVMAQEETLTSARRTGWSHESLTRLWRQHRRWLAAVLWAHKPRDADIEDLLQEVAMKMVTHLHTLDDPAAIRPWLRTVAINVARSAGRKQRTHDGVFQSGGIQEIGLAEGNGRHHPDDSNGPPPNARSALDLAMQLPLHYREPLILSLRGLAQKEIALVLDVPLTTVETRLIRARRMVRDALERTRSADPPQLEPSGERHV